MYVLITYDVAAERTERFRKILSRYLIHEQNSVFSGDLAESGLTKLHAELKRAMVANDRLMQVLAENRRNVAVSLLLKDAANGTLTFVPHDSHKTDSIVI